MSDDNVRMPFSLECVRDLWKYLGEFDAISELNEIALRDLLLRCERVRRFGGEKSVEKYIQKASRLHGIRVHAAVRHRVSVGMAQAYVVSAYHSADAFLTALRSQHQALTDSTWTGDARGKTKLDLALENLFGSVAQGMKAVNPHRYTVFNYYRAIRNRVVHPKSTDDETVDRAYMDVGQYVQQLQNEYKMTNAPRPRNAMCFEDSLLFSRVLKDMAAVLNEKAKPAPEVLLRNIDLRRFDRVRNDPVRRRHAIRSELSTRFGLDQSEADAIIGSDSLA
jgi:hypothetical protein